MSDLYEVIAALTECVRAALAGTAAGEPARICTVPGALAWDECDCGLLAITVDRIYPSNAFPTEAAPTLAACTAAYEVADLTVTVLRCAPNPVGNALAPTCVALDAAALTWFLDMDAVRGALGCCLAGLRDAGTVEELVLRDTVPAGPQGGCVGSDTRLTVGFIGCLCPAGV